MKSGLVRGGSTVPYSVQLDASKDGARVFIDTHGRMVETINDQPGAPRVVRFLGEGNKVVQEFQRDGAAYRNEERDAGGKPIRESFIDPATGDVTVLDLLADQVTVYRDYEDGSVTAFVIRGGMLVRTESISNDGTTKLVTYEKSESGYEAKSAKVALPDGSAVSNVVYGKAPDGKRLMLVSHSISKESMEWKFTGSRQPAELVLTTSIATTALKRNPRNGFLEGNTVNAAGVVLWDVSMDSRARFLLTDDESSESKVIRTKWNGAGYAASEVLGEDMHWDPEAGAVERFLDGEERILQYSSGRSDRYDADGGIAWANEYGEESNVSAQGTVKIKHKDGSTESMRLDAEGEASPVEIKEFSGLLRDPLSEAEIEFLKEHSNSIDPRDFVRMHCRLRNRAHQIDGVLSQLQELKSVEGISAEQLQMLTASLLHHVAYPEEIAQGRSVSGPSAVIEMDLALENPVRYIAIVKECLQTGHLRLAGGHIANMNTRNLIQIDSSGRDLACRIFQTGILSAFSEADVTVRNSRTGIALSSDKTHDTYAMSLEQVSNAIFELGGGETCVVEVRCAGDLLAAYKASWRKSMLLAVDGSLPPFGRMAGTGQRSRPELVCVLSVRETEHPRFFLANPLGVARQNRRDDPSFDCLELFKNMQAPWGVGGAGLALVRGGQHGTRFIISAGSLIRKK